MKVVNFRNSDLLKDAFVPQSFAGLVDSLMNEGMQALPFSPAADILDKEKEYELRLMLPGFGKEDVKVELDGQKLTVSGERKKVQEENVKFLVTESRYGKFSRSFMLAKNADAENISAAFENGVLMLNIPKREDAKPKNIEIK